ncbi:Mediator Of Rna polymerase Ii Transcription Subunit 24 [Manis pentadactyla]|nr:Mediator Of Rna polymerase Ii Transcription Subunit 24 [Manis pentadactyla]
MYDPGKVKQQVDIQLHDIQKLSPWSRRLNPVPTGHAPCTLSLDWDAVALGPCVNPKPTLSITPFSFVITVRLLSETHPRSDFTSNVRCEYTTGPAVHLLS